MGNLSNNNDLLKGLSASRVMTADQLGATGEIVANQKSELKKLFTEVSENNATADDKKALEARIHVLKKEVERLEAKMATLQEQLAEKQALVKEKAAEVTELVSKAETFSENLKEEQRTFLENAYEDVFWDYKRGIIKQNEIYPELTARIADKNLAGDAAYIQDIVETLEMKQSELQPLIQETTTIVDQANALEARYGITKSSYLLLNKTLEQIGATETTYTNSDASASAPIYSVGKLEVLAGLTEKFSTNENFEKTTVANEQPQGMNLEQIQEKYKDYLKIPASGGDSNSYDNVAVQKLGEAIDNGMLEDLAASNLPKADIVNFLSENFAGANIKANGNGSLTIPYGHYSNAERQAGNSIVSDKNKACQIYNKLTDFVKSDVDVEFLGEYQEGNTIGSNPELSALSENMKKDDNIVQTLFENNFTFKEAMYAMFNPDTGLFKDTGITYDLAKQDNGAYFEIASAGDEETANFFSEFNNVIYNVYGVKANGSAGANVDRSDEKPTEVKRTDPVSFTLDGDKNKEYSFVIDRDGDGKFSGKNDFVGATGDIKGDLKSLDKNKDGKLTGDELKNLKVISTKYNEDTSGSVNVQNAAYKEDRTTQVDYSLTNAKSLGITSLNTSVSNEGSTGKYDMNGSEIFGDTVSFTMNNKTVEATRKDDTDSFLNTIYGDAKGKNFDIGLTNSQADAIINESFGEYDQFRASYSDVLGDIELLRGIGQVAQNTEGLYDITVQNLEDQRNDLLRRANNESTAFSPNSGWSSIVGNVDKEWSSLLTKSEYKSLKGEKLDMTQAKGIYMLTGASTAKEVAKEYADMLITEQEIANNYEYISIGWEAIILCAREGIKTTAREILFVLSKGYADDAQGVVDYMLETKGRTMTPKDVELDLDDERTKELVEAFRDEFGANAINKLYELCVAQQDDRSFMQGKSGAELAKALR